MKWNRIVSPALLVMALALLAPLARAQVLQSVPSDALVVIKFNKLKATSDKLAAMAQKLGVAQWQPAMADPLGSFKKEAKLTNGLDDNGEAAVVIPSSIVDQKNAAGKSKAMILLLPVTDYKAFIGNFQGATTAGDITTVKFGTNTDNSYVANWGKYAAIGTSQDLVTKKPDGLTAQGVTAKELAEKDIILFANMKAVRTYLMPQMAKARQDFIKGFEQNYARGVNQSAPRGRGAAGGAAPASQPAMKFMPVMSAFMNRAFDVFETFVRDSDAATYGISIADDGIRTTALAEFTANSPSAQRLAQFKGTNQSLTAGLPQTKYIFFGGTAADPKATQQVVSDFVGPIEQKASTLGEEGKALTSYLAALKKYVSTATGSTFGWVEPGGALGQEAIFQVVGINRGNADAMLTAQREMFNSQQAFMEMFQPPQMRGQVKLTYTDNAKTVDGVQLNQFQTQFTPPAGGQRTPQQMQMQQMMTWMYGPNGMNGYAGKVGNDKMIAAVGTSDAVLQQLITAAKANEDPLSKSQMVASVKAKLPQQRIAEGYLALDQLVGTIANYAKMFGAPVNLQLPAELPPIGGTIATEGSAIRADGYVPAQLVQSLIAAGMQAYMQMQGGQQPGGPGGL